MKSGRQFYSGLGNRVRQPNLNFAPQLGIAWDPNKNGKSVIRAGIGLFYENSIWNNILFDPGARLQKGLFLGFAGACANGSAPAGGVAFPDGTIHHPTFCWQPSVGVQREIRRGTVLAVDFLRNVSTHNFLIVDTNHVGDARFFNQAAALAAINATVGSVCGGGTVTAATSISAVQCFIAANPTAGISAFARNGLDSGYVLCVGFPCGGAAFPGINNAVGANEMLFPIGRSVYNGLQMALKQDVANPAPGIKHVNLQG